MSAKCGVVIHSSVEWSKREVGGKRMSDRQNTSVRVRSSEPACNSIPCTRIDTRDTG